MPLQGFLNAIVYGWARDDFVSDMALTSLDLRTQIKSNDHLSKLFAKRQITKVKTEEVIVKKKIVQDVERPITVSMGVTEGEWSEDNY